MIAASFGSSARWIILAACVLLAGRPELRAQATASLSGVVLDAEAHQPIARVLVETSTGFPGQLTDSSGRFSFSNVHSGSVRVRFRRPGYYDPFTGQRSGVQTVDLEASTPPQTLLLAPLATLRGQVTVPEGDSPDGVSLELYSAYVEAGWRRWVGRASTRVRSDGSFVFADLEPGSYLVHAQGSLDPTPYPEPSGIGFGYAPVFAPDAHDVASAMVYTLAPGGSGQVNLVLSRVPFYPVTIAAAGEFHGFGARITGNGFTRWNARYSGEDRSFHAQLPSGAYTLLAEGLHADPQHGIESAMALFHVDGAPVSGPSVAVTHQAPITLTTRTEGAAEDNAVPPHIVYLRFDSLDDRLAREIAVPVEPQDGEAGVVNVSLAAGQYWVEARPNSGYVAALSSGGVDLLSQPLTVEPGTAVSLAATLRTDTGSLLITLVDAAAAEPCTLHLVPLSEGAEEQTRRALGATVTIANVAPGDYLVFATAGRVALPFREPGALRQLAGQRVTVASGAAASVTMSALFTPPPNLVEQP